MADKDLTSLRAETAGKDWTKFVTISPPASITFQENQEDGKSISFIQIINKYSESIIFKVIQ